MKKKTKYRDPHALDAKTRKAAGPMKDKRERKSKRALEKELFEHERQEALETIHRWMGGYPPSDTIRKEIRELALKYHISVFDIIKE